MGNLSRDVNLETSEPNNTIASGASTRHQKEGHSLVGDKDDEASTPKKSESKFARVLGFFKRKEKNKNNSNKRGRFKSLFLA